MSSWFTLLPGVGGVAGGVEGGMEGGRGNALSWSEVGRQVGSTDAQKEGGREGGREGGTREKEKGEWKEREEERERVLVGGPLPCAEGYSSSSSPSLLHLTPQEHEQQKHHKESPSHLTCRIFATSLNCGPCTRINDLGCLEEWIPKGTLPPSLLCNLRAFFR